MSETLNHKPTVPILSIPTKHLRQSHSLGDGFGRNSFGHSTKRVTFSESHEERPILKARIKIGKGRGRGRGRGRGGGRGGKTTNRGRGSRSIDYDNVFDDYAHIQPVHHHISPVNDNLALSRNAIASSSMLEPPQELWCICRRPYTEGETMIECEFESCPFQWYHLECVGLQAVPEGQFFCNTSECTVLRRNLERREKRIKRPSERLIGHYTQ